MYVVNEASAKYAVSALLSFVIEQKTNLRTALIQDTR